MLWFGKEPVTTLDERRDLEDSSSQVKAGEDCNPPLENPAKKRKDDATNFKGEFLCHYRN